MIYRVAHNSDFWYSVFQHQSHHLRNIPSTIVPSFPNFLKPAYWTVMDNLIILLQLNGNRSVKKRFGEGKFVKIVTSYNGVMPLSKDLLSCLLLDDHSVVGFVYGAYTASMTISYLIGLIWFIPTWISVSKLWRCSCNVVQESKTWRICGRRLNLIRQYLWIVDTATGTFGSIEAQGKVVHPGSNVLWRYQSQNVHTWSFWWLGISAEIGKNGETWPLT